MDRVFTSAIAALLFIHTACGCCWYNAHKNAACGHPHLPGLAGTCCQHDNRATDGDESSDGPCRCRLECQGVCTYLPPQKAQIDPPHLSIPFDLPAPPSASADAHFASAWRGEFASGPIEPRPPLRLHLLHQILLI